MLTYMGVGEHFFHDEVVVHLLGQFSPLLQAFRFLVVFNLRFRKARGFRYYHRKGARVGWGFIQLCDVIVTGRLEYKIGGKKIVSVSAGKITPYKSLGEEHNRYQHRLQSVDKAQT